MGRKLPGLLRYPQQLDGQGRVLIPKPLRDKVGWKKKDWLEVYEHNGKIVIEKASIATV